MTHEELNQVAALDQEIYTTALQIGVSAQAGNPVDFIFKTMRLHYYLRRLVAARHKYVKEHADPVVAELMRSLDEADALADASQRSPDAACG